MRRTFELLEGRRLLHGAELIQTSHEVVPNYVTEPDTLTVADGNWFDPTIWSNGVPTAEMDAQIDHIVTIEQFIDRRPGDFNNDGQVNTADYVMWCDGLGAQFSYDDLALFVRDFFRPLPPAAFASHAVAEDINIHGKLTFARDADTSLQVTTLTVLERGILELGSEESPITASAEIIFRDAPIDTQFDPQQFGHGLLVMGNATLSVYGREATSFIQAAQAPRAGDTLLTLAEAPDNWLPGDELWIADSRHTETFDASQAERLVIQSIEGNQVRLTEGLAYDHPGSGDFLLHIVHLSGNVTFRSANPDGTRGHIMIMERAEVRVHDAVFSDLGRTTVDRLDNTHLGPNREVLHVGKNQIGRYTFHMHHAYGPEGLADAPQFELVGNRFVDGKRWGVAIHDTHYGLVANNVLVNFQSAGIVFEDGSEFGNRIERNFIGLIPGSGEGVGGRIGLSSDPLGPLEFGGGPHPTAVQEVMLWGDGTAENPYRTLGDLGHEGAGIWGRSASNHIVDNVIANAQSGNVLWTRFLVPGPLPAFPGADPRVNGVAAHRGQQLGHEFRGNEVYASHTAYNWLGVAQGDAGAGSPDTVFLAQDNRAWNNGVFAYDLRYCGNIVIVGGEIRGKANHGAGVNHSFASSVVVDGLRVIGFRVGAFIPNGAVRNSYFENARSPIVSRSSDIELENNTFVDGDDGSLESTTPNVASKDRAVASEFVIALDGSAAA